MFKQARLKLTTWYLIIIMIVSLTFSGVIYRAATFELNRFARAQQNRYVLRPGPPPINEDLLIDAQSRLLKALLLINIGILGSAALLGYYLSGKTLRPIAEMMDEQYRFVSDASHELKTPITAIKTTLEVALRDPKMGIQEAKKTLVTSLSEVNGLQKLAEGLLELSSDHRSIKYQKVNLKEILLEAIKLFDPLTKSRNIQVVTTLSKVIVWGESESLKRAITTIIDNAIKYSSANSKIYISLKKIGKAVAIKIKDDGSGVDESEIPLIFNRFYRSDKARNTEGYGLGLSISKKIIESHKGAIQVESQKDKGTTITLLLPYSAQIQN